MDSVTVDKRAVVLPAGILSVAYCSTPIVSILDCGVTMKLTPSFKLVIQEAARVCFGNLPIVNYRTGFKYLKRKPMGDYAINHYLPDYTRAFRDNTSDFSTALEDRAKDRHARLKFRGKGPPKKGQGKRASKKKK